MARCFYCSADATGVDHVVPRALLNRLTTISIKGTPVVPCCIDCNVTAGDRVFPTLAAKRAYIAGRVRKRFSKLLAMPSWSRAELDALSPVLRTHIEAQLAARSEVRARLVVLERRARSERRRPAVPRAPKPPGKMESRDQAVLAALLFVQGTPRRWAWANDVRRYLAASADLGRFSLGLHLRRLIAVDFVQKRQVKTDLFAYRVSAAGRGAHSDFTAKHATFIPAIEEGRLALPAGDTSERRQ